MISLKHNRCTFLGFFLIAIWGISCQKLRPEAKPDPRTTLEVQPNGTVTLSHIDLSLTLDTNFQLTPTFSSNSGPIHLIASEENASENKPHQTLSLKGQPDLHFTLDRGHDTELHPIETVHGKGYRFSFWASAKHQASGKVQQRVSLEFYEKYPHAVLFQTRYVNMGTSPLPLDSYTEAAFTLDSTDLWAFHSRNWRWGEDFIFPLHADPQLSGENIGIRIKEDRYTIFGGGLPAVSYMSPEGTFTLGYLSPKLKRVRFPIQSTPTGVSVGIERDIAYGPEKQVLTPGDTLTTLPTFMSLTTGDFYEGILTMRQLHEDLGMNFPDPPIPDVTAPAWSNRAPYAKWDKQYILDRLPFLRKYGIKWIHFGDPWQDNMGNYGASERFESEEDLQAFVQYLHDEGFYVTAFFSDLVVEESAEVAQNHPEYFVHNADGSLLKVQSFGRDCLALCPSYLPARAFIRQAAEKLAGYYGFDGVKNDGHAVPLPCFEPTHRHPYPEQATEDYALMQQEVLEAFYQYKPEGAVVAFCFDGVVPLFYQHPTTTRPWPNADQTSEKQSRWKQKLYKAILGPQRILLDDHSDLQYLTGTHGTWYLGPVSGLAMGAVLETVAGPTYDTDAHDYDEIFEAYHREMLPKGGEYLNLYHLVHDYPEGHVVQKGETLYYGFFTETFKGILELRGLEPGITYEVVDYLHGKSFPDIVATDSTATLEAAFERYVLIKLVPKVSKGGI